LEKPGEHETQEQGSNIDFLDTYKKECVLNENLDHGFSPANPKSSHRPNL